MKEKLKNYSFWVGLSASIILVVKFVAGYFGFELNEKAIDNVINSILGVLVVVGVINKPTKNLDVKLEEAENENTSKEQLNSNESNEDDNKNSN